nr:EOG090X0FYC [Eubosmina coregoni]
MSLNATVICFSGKRKTGKDFVAELLHKRLSPRSVIIRISAPIKHHFAKTKNLDVDELLSDGLYKENFRAEMIVWGEQQRIRDPSIFCKSAIEMFNGHLFPIWIVPDLRRTTDLKFFRENYTKLFAVRIDADLEARLPRGFSFTSGIDDAESECGLDAVEDWDLTIKNNGDQLSLDKYINTLIEFTNH